jgi:hypothetical protein
MFFSKVHAGFEIVQGKNEALSFREYLIGGGVILGFRYGFGGFLGILTLNAHCVPIDRFFCCSNEFQKQLFLFVFCVVSV